MLEIIKSDDLGACVRLDYVAFKVQLVANGL